jgi:hypothetical protein
MTEAYTLLRPRGAVPDDVLHGRTLFGRDHELMPRLKVYNDLGYDVFWTVNETDGVGRRAENIVRARYLFTDLDNGLPTTWLLEPSCIIASSPGRYQAYYMLEDPTLDFALWGRVQRAVVRETGGDANAQDLARILRVNGYRNWKRGGFEVRVVGGNMLSHKLSELRDAFGEVELTKPATTTPLTADELPPEEQRLKRWKSWLAACEIPRGGERNGFYFRAACKGVRDFVVDQDDVYDTLQDYWDRNDVTGDDPRLEGIVRNAARSASGALGSAFVGPRFHLLDEENE